MALFATAFREGVIRANPAAGLWLAHRQEVDETARETRTKALTPAELRTLLVHVPGERRLLVELGAQSCARFAIVLGV